jgi:ribosome-binding factor A
VAGEIRRALQEELARGLNDPRVQGLISITEVVLTPDLADARVHVSVLPEDRASLTLSGLRAAAGFLRRRVMEGTRIGRVPRIGFELDERLKRQAALDTILRAEQPRAEEIHAPADPAADSPAENTTR